VAATGRHLTQQSAEQGRLARPDQTSHADHCSCHHLDTPPAAAAAAINTAAAAPPLQLTDRGTQPQLEPLLSITAAAAATAAAALCWVSTSVFGGAPAVAACAQPREHPPHVMNRLCVMPTASSTGRRRRWRVWRQRGVRQGHVLRQREELLDAAEADRQPRPLREAGGQHD
jgi:hypothetical protein